MSLLNWLRDRRGDLVWSTLVIVTVLLPLGGLSLDVPRYFLLRSNLATPTIDATPASLSLYDDTDQWDVSLTDADALTDVTQAPAFQKRFPDGLTITLIDDARAPEALRGDYDADPFALRFGAVWPGPTACGTSSWGRPASSAAISPPAANRARASTVSPPPPCTRP